VQFDVSLAGFLVGIVVGLTGMGGGALMTPILVLVFNVQPLAAVSSDLVAAVVMKPIGGGIHWRRRTVHTGLVRWLAAGSIPGAIGGSYLISHVEGDVDAALQTVLGIVLLVAATAMTTRWWLVAHRAEPAPTTADGERPPVRRVLTLLVGVVGGLVVGVTTVGSGSLMIVALMLLYPTMMTRELVGTDLVQAVPLVAAAALGHVLWGNLEFGLTGSLLLGSVPGVIVGAQLSSRANDAAIRPVLVSVLVLTGAKLLAAPNEVLGAVIVIAVAVGGVLGWRAVQRRSAARLGPTPDL
jgi:uncharacterized membrane protein YfcA